MKFFWWDMDGFLKNETSSTTKKMLRLALLFWWAVGGLRNAETTGDDMLRCFQMFYMLRGVGDGSRVAQRGYGLSACWLCSIWISGFCFFFFLKVVVRLSFLHPCTHRRVTLCPWGICVVWGSAWGSLSLMLETHASQTATKESSGRNTRAHRWQKVLGGRHDSLRFATHRWHWKRVPGPSISAISSFFITKWRQSVPGPDVPAPFLLTHRWRRILGSSVCTANTNARPSDNITKPAAAATAIHNSGSNSSDASAGIQTGAAGTQAD